ncbi:hypothetical protein LBMAG53_13980 [Planctomycetota bacterium]|nr:hypothetical protein LBMAG53_13980 [Planctomycetota bacterium]
MMLNLRASWAMTLLLASAVDALAADPRWEAIAAKEPLIATAQARIRDLKAFTTYLGETMPAGKNAALDQARSAVETATAEAKKARAAIDALQEHQHAASQERNAKIDALLADVPRFKQLLEKKAKAKETALGLMPRVTALSPDEARTYARARVDEDRADGELYAIRKIYWFRSEVAEAHKKAADLYTKIESAGKAKGVSEASKALGDAKKALREAQLAAAMDQATTDELAMLEKTVEEQKAAIQAIRQELPGSWTPFRTEVTPAAKDDAKTTEKPKPLPVTVEIPTGCKQVRGVLFTFMGTVQNDPMVRGVLAENQFAVISMPGIGIFTTPADQALLMTGLEKLSEKSQHPELALVPWLTAGCSTTTITARNIVAWKPERSVGAILWAGGNLHQHQTIPNWSLAGVPILNVTGEWECYGPEGGVKDGIQPAYGRLTQWVMIREQIQRLRTKDPSHLFSLVVIPGADHAQWSSATSPVAALFIRKAIQARLPASTDLPKEPVKCKPIAPESGYLTDPDLYDPKLPAAPVAAYSGQPGKAFWHIDQELADAVDAFHRGKFFLPDPTKQVPVPADWPPVKVKKASE